jgi:hypothetical protein
MARPKASAAAVAPAQEPIQENVSYDAESVLRALKQEVDPSLIRQREGWRDRNGNVKMVDYIEWHTACDILDDVYPEWSHQIKTVQMDGNVVYCIVALTVAGVTREGLGCGDATRGETGFKKAEHDALKRAAVKFGVARDLYHKEEGAYEQSGVSGGGNGAPKVYTNERPADPFLRDPKDAPSEGQGRAMFAISKAVGYDQDAFAAQLFPGCTSVSQLNRKAASFMIDQLDKLKNPAAVPAMTGVPPVSVIPPVTEQLPAGVTRGMPPPPQVNITVPSVAQGVPADINTVNSLKILCQKKNVDPVAIASQYSGGRATKPEEMSQPECVAAHDAVAAM